mgnify:CR=1 FL=1
MRGGLVAALLAAALPAAAAEAPPGASSCSGCHAPAGVQAAIPTLDGRPAAEIAATMADFRTGRRAATVMDRIAKGFTAAETEAIAAWIARER